MRVFKSKWFTRFADAEGITDEDLKASIANADQGLIEANLGGGVIKQRIAREGSGKSAGYRTIVLYRTATRSFFVYGFPKSSRANIKQDELAAFKKLAKATLDLSEGDLKKALQNGTYVEVI
ncbi:type II toxin-antitoxin system RelE/ParE family toxin [Pseudomonas luteola]|uniref:type II toxin-antitoxin system RelE/ParE family toxin n=1 Tax=Pseudomonas luteola TaxID=47886 RepID=UPI0015E33B05|nr:type II toxin-antitoxin system RelE/ParE family toxin [Pseudomonas zeshuii]